MLKSKPPRLTKDKSISMSHWLAVALDDENHSLINHCFFEPWMIGDDFLLVEDDKDFAVNGKKLEYFEEEGAMFTQTEM